MKNWVASSVPGSTNSYGHRYERLVPIVLATLRTVEATCIAMKAASDSLRQTVFGILKMLVVRASQNNLNLMYDVESDIPIEFTPSKMTQDMSR